MKTKLILSAALIGALFSSCKKNDATPTTTTTTTTTTPTVTYLISKDSATSTNPSQSTEVRRFTYNSSKNLVKVEHKPLPGSVYTNFDTLIYNTNGQLTTVKNYAVGSTTANQTSTVSYNGSGQLTTVAQLSIQNSTPYASSTAYTYTSGKITGVISVDTSANGSNDTITNIVYNGDNIASLIYDGQSVTATVSTTAANPYYGLNFDPTDFINVINKNNMLMAYFTSNPTSILQNTTYTYADGRVATSIDTNVDTSVNPAVTTATTTYITYKAY